MPNMLPINCGETNQPFQKDRICPDQVAHWVPVWSPAPKVAGLIREHTWVLGSIPGQGAYRRQLMDVSQIDVSLSH